MLFTLSAYGGVAFPCVCGCYALCSVLTPVIIMYRGGREGREGGEWVYNIILCKFRVMLQIWGCINMYVDSIGF
jgi:hypothetical protein